MYKRQIQKTYGIIKQYAGVKTKYFLPPYGVLEADVLHAAQQSDHQLVLASVDSQDWLDIPPEQMLGNVLSLSLIHIFPEKAMIKLSMRCRKGYNVGKLAASFGGGGHVLAAGCKISGALTEVVELVLAKAREMIESCEAEAVDLC